MNLKEIKHADSLILLRFVKKCSPLKTETKLLERMQAMQNLTRKQEAAIRGKIYVAEGIQI